MDSPDASMSATPAVSGHPPFPLSPSLTWFELFYDLVFVAAVIIFSNAVSAHPTWSVASGLASVFAIVWFVWLLTVLLVNVFHRDDPLQRALVLAQMFVVTLVSVAVGVITELVEGDVYHWGALMAGALLGSVPVAVMYSFFVEYYVAGMTGAVKE